ncbi:MAG: DNA-binding protein, partial [Mucilaginibacter sp.]|nr:DNA-binding protein [Mucilaginibacter sp.]
LPLMAGVPMESAEKSEKVLADVRQTIAELLVYNFYGTMAKLAHEKGCTFTAESVAPTMMSDGMLHYQKADIPMGEFWFRSPTHDKPNDMLDAISGGHIYGKNIIQAEAFTELRLLWDEHPGMLKTTADRNFALGINRYVFHVNVHNPWLDRKPGMTLDGIGLFFQRDQTWWQPGKAWFDYISRCQAMLQQGHPVADIAVFTGEETPRRAILPDRLVSTLPGIFGVERVRKEAERLANKDVPVINSVEDASHSANMALPENWVDPLRGYAYDSFNKDALLRLATVKNGRIILPGGASYAMLVVPGVSQMSPQPWLLSAEVMKKLQQLVNQGATVLLGDERMKTTLTGIKPTLESKLLTGPYQKDTFDEIGISRDLIATDSVNQPAKDLAWTHRAADGLDIYFISNQQALNRTINLSLRISGRVPELWDPLTGEIKRLHSVNKPGRTNMSINLAANGSAFIVLRNSHPGAKPELDKAVHFKTVQTFTNWQVQFDPKSGGPAKPVTFDKPDDWSLNENDSLKYYSGTAIYSRTFQFTGKSGSKLYLDLGKVANLAEVYLNGINCGTAWTFPYRVNISKAVKSGQNNVVIKVTNTWANRLMGDHTLPEAKRITWTNAPYRLEGRSLLPAGLLSPVRLLNDIP